MTSVPNSPKNKMVSSSKRVHPAADDPLSVISARHTRHREVCQSLKPIAKSRVMTLDDFSGSDNFFTMIYLIIAMMRRSVSFRCCGAVSSQSVTSI